MYLLIFLGVTGYHKTLLKDVNGLKLLPRPKVSLINKNNISKKQEALLISYQASNGDENSYAALKSHNRKFYSTMHNGIQKFSKELNDYVCRMSPNSKIVLIPWAKWEIPGSMNAKKLVLVPHIIQMIRQVNSVKDIPYEVAPKKTPSISYKLDDPWSSYNWRNWQNCMWLKKLSKLLLLINIWISAKKLSAM